MKAADLWLEFLGANGTLCGLCGNSGWVDTRNMVRSYANVECGVRRYCICPNGRSIKKLCSPFPEAKK